MAGTPENAATKTIQPKLKNKVGNQSNVEPRISAASIYREQL
jgi:hypothetical protein